MPKVYFAPAECWAGCTDRDCPYSHLAGWQCQGIEGLFDTEQEAIEAGKGLNHEQK